MESATSGKKTVESAGQLRKPVKEVAAAHQNTCSLVAQGMEHPSFSGRLGLRLSMLRNVRRFCGVDGCVLYSPSTKACLCRRKAQQRASGTTAVDTAGSEQVYHRRVLGRRLPEVMQMPLFGRRALPGNAQPEPGGPGVRPTRGYKS